MPRDVNGNYTLPSGNPVVTGTVISSVWGNTTLSDIATAVTNSLDRTGTSVGMTGQFKAISGTVGTPGISFQAEPTMGIYRAAAGDLRFAIGGVDVLRFTANSILAANGAIGTPSYSFVNETNSGLYRAAAGDFRFSIAGVDIVKIVAAGMTAPTYTVTGATVPANGIYLSAANTLAFATNTTIRGSINSTGNWVIAASSAGTPLSISNRAGSGQVVILTANDGNGVISFSPTDGSGSYALNLLVDATGGKIGTNSNNRDLQFQTNSITALRLTSGQLVQAIDQASNFWDIGWRDLPLNQQNASYGLVLADRGKLIVFNGAAGQTYTIPSNASIAYAVGTTIVIGNVSGNNLTISITTDTLFLAGTSTTGSRTLADRGLATIVKLSTTQWVISGSGVS